MTASHHYFTSVARGLIPGHSRVFVNGHIAALGTTLATVWEGGGTYVPLVAAKVLKVSSSDADDTLLGAGARTVKITGLDTDYKVVTDTVELDGQTAVNTVVEFLRVNFFEVLTVGATGYNEGTVYVGDGTVTAGVPATKYSVMLTKHNAAFSGHYTVPAGFTAYVHSAFFSSGSAKLLHVFGFMSAPGGPYVARYANHSFEVPFDHKFEAPFPIPEKYDLDFRGQFTTGTHQAAAGFELVLIKNGL